jgi:anti-sigma regulatory factor (Ser/Thr protein kinase)
MRIVRAGDPPVHGAERRIEFVLHAYAENVFLVRNLVDQAAMAWALPEAVHQDARLVLSELAANACRLYAGRMIKTWVTMPAARMLEVAVWDPDASTPPERRPLGEDDESGRGLHLVEACAREWGWSPAEAAGGKVVWARLAW